MGSSVLKDKLGRSSGAEILLWNDDFACMLAICNVMHMRHTAAVPPVDWADLYELSKKYDVVAAMAPVALTWMEDALDDVKKDSTAYVVELHYMFAAAVGFNGQRLATRLGRELVDHSDTAIDDDCECSDVVPAGIYAQLEVMRKTIKDALYATLDSCINILEGYVGEKPCDDAACAATHVLLHSFLEYLRSMSLWPLREFELGSVHKIRRQMSQIPSYTSIPWKPVREFACRKGKDCIAFHFEQWPETSTLYRDAANAARSALDRIVCKVDEDGKITAFVEAPFQ